MRSQDWKETLAGALVGTLAVAGYLAAVGGGLYLFSSTWDECSEMGGLESLGTMREFAKGIFTGIPVDATQNPDASMGAVIASIGVPSIVSSISSVDDSSGGDIFEVIFFWKNQMPYSRIERNAQRIFDKYHRKKNFKMNFPVVIASSKETMNYADKLFSSESVDDSLENIEVIERLINESIND